MRADIDGGVAVSKSQVRRIVTCRVLAYDHINAHWYAARDPSEWGEPMGQGASEYEARANLVEREKLAVKGITG